MKLILIFILIILIIYYISISTKNLGFNEKDPFPTPTPNPSICKQVEQSILTRKGSFTYYSNCDNIKPNKMQIQNIGGGPEAIQAAANMSCYIVNGSVITLVWNYDSEPSRALCWFNLLKDTIKTSKYFNVAIELGKVVRLLVCKSSRVRLG